MVRIGGASIILLAVFLDAKNKALDFEVFFFISLSSHQSEKFSRSAFIKKVQVGKDQEKAQSEKDSHSKNRGGKKPNQQSGTHTMKTFRKPNEQLFSQ